MKNNDDKKKGTDWVKVVEVVASVIIIIITQGRVKKL